MAQVIIYGPGEQARLDMSRSASLSSAGHPEWQHQAHDWIREAIQRQAFMHRRDALAAERSRYKRSRVEGRILKAAFNKGLSVFRPRLTRDAPSCWRQRRQGRRFDGFITAEPVEAQCERQVRFPPTLSVIEDRCAVAQAGAQPCPSGKRMFERFCAGIGVEITAAAPAQVRRAKIKGYARGRRYGAPEMAPMCFQKKGFRIDRQGFDTNFSPNASREWRRYFIYVNCQRLFVP